MARLGRARDTANYTRREVRRIDRRLHRKLGRQQSTSSRGRFGLAFRIPVRAHVIDGADSRGPSKKRVRNQLAVLNRAYAGGQSAANADTSFRFYLESFDRTRNERWYTATMFDPEERQLRRALHEGGRDALNLYFSAPHSPEAGTAVLGWSSVPWRAKGQPKLDGVTLHQASMPGGHFRDYNRGDTAVHEVGHWLGLFHTFEGGCSARNDLVADTPAEESPTMGCPARRDSCKASGLDPIHNFMDYSFDRCMYRFTPGQVDRMTDNWLAYRTP